MFFRGWGGCQGLRFRGLVGGGVLVGSRRHWRVWEGVLQELEDLGSQLGSEGSGGVVLVGSAGARGGLMEFGGPGGTGGGPGEGSSSQP